MARSFEQDLHPGNPRILFIGLAQSTHTQAWIDLLRESEFNVRLFAVSEELPPDDWPVKVYVSRPKAGTNSSTRKYFNSGIQGNVRSLYERVLRKIGRRLSKRDAWLANIIKEWQPDIIHTLGLFDEQGGLFYLEARQKFHLEHYGKWVLQLRGGSDMALRRYDPEQCRTIQRALSECDQIVSDNLANIKYAGELGIPAEKFAPLGPVSGSGGLDLKNENFSELTLPSRRERIILWPKAYEAQWSKALPVLDAIRIAWAKLQPCEVYMLAMSPDVHEWYLTLPEEIRKYCHTHNRISRQEALALMSRARVLLAPSLVDGVPNVLYEAMAYGAFPIVSPLETITPVVKENENVLFARNLYPEEIASALVRAMIDDSLVDKAAENNFQLVQKIADRSKIRAQLVSYYQMLAGKA